MSSDEQQKTKHSNSDIQRPEPLDLSTMAKVENEERREEAKELCRDMFEKITNYVNGELGGREDVYILYIYIAKHV